MQEVLRDAGMIPGSGRFPGVGNDNLLQYSCLGNFMDREACQATVHEVAKSQIRLSDYYNTEEKRIELIGTLVYRCSRLLSTCQQLDQRLTTFHSAD